MSGPNQLSFFKSKVSPSAVDLAQHKDKNCLEFGGSLLVGKRKSKRPFKANKPQHVVLKSFKAPQLKCFLGQSNQMKIEKILKESAAKWNVRVHEIGFETDHIHLAIHTKHKKNFSSFLRVIAGQISMWALETKKGTKAKEKFWSMRPYTKIISWGRQLLTLKKYIFKNTLESAGIYSRREPFSKQVLDQWWRTLKEIKDEESVQNMLL